MKRARGRGLVVVTALAFALRFALLGALLVACDPSKSANGNADANANGHASADAGANANPDANVNGVDADANANASASSGADANANDLDAGLDGEAEGNAVPFVGVRHVLHVGDSMVGYQVGLRNELRRMFGDAGIEYVSDTVTSAGLHSFAEERVVEKMVKKHSPDLVIVQLGTNNLTVPHPDAYLADIKSILSQVGGRACYWIGPVSIKFPERGMRGYLRENVAPCVFFDSYDLTLERQADGLHPSQSGSKIWAKAFWAFASENHASALR